MAEASLFDRVLQSIFGKDEKRDDADAQLCHG